MLLFLQEMKMLLRMKNPQKYGKIWEFLNKGYFICRKKTTGGVLQDLQDLAVLTRKCFMTPERKSAAKAASLAVHAGNILRFGMMSLCNITRQKTGNMSL